LARNNSAMSKARRQPAIPADWWATLVAGVIAALAVADVLPRIPW
jgi:hypothetical protein